MLCRSHTSEHKALPALDCQGLEQQLVHMLGSGTKKGSLKQRVFFFFFCFGKNDSRNMGCASLGYPQTISGIGEGSNYFSY